MVPGTVDGGVAGRRRPNHPKAAVYSKSNEGNALIYEFDLWMSVAVGMLNRNHRVWGLP